MTAKWLQYSYTTGVYKQCIKVPNKVVKGFINGAIKQHLVNNTLLTGAQLGFCKGHCSDYTLSSNMDKRARFQRRVVSPPPNSPIVNILKYALHVYNEIMNVGQKYGIRNAGYYALRSLRIEKFFAFWGQDLDAFTTPLECGREFRVKFDKGTDFIGRDALLQQRQEGVCRRFTMFILDDHDTDLDLWPWWSEPIFRNGRYVGMTTSSAYSYTLARHVCLGFVHQYDEDTGAKLVVTPDFVNR
eukprot:g46110.t1